MSKILSSINSLSQSNETQQIKKAEINYGTIDNKPDEKKIIHPPPLPQDLVTNKNIADQSIPVEKKIQETQNMNDEIEKKEINDDLFKVSEHLIDRSEIKLTETIGKNGEIIYNEWTAENSKTIQEWSTQINLLMKKYQKSIMKYERLRNTFNLLPLIITGLTMILGFLQVSGNNLGSIIGEKNIILVNICFCIANFLLSTLTTLLNGISKLKKFDTKVLNLVRLVERLYGFNNILKTELSINEKLRINASQFIKKYSRYYITLLDIDVNFPTEDLTLD